jgi:hypothetical protein
LTMHLVGPYMTTTNYRKPKQKPRTKVQQAKLEEAHKAYNKSMKQIGCQDQMMTLENYDMYTRGLYKPKLKGVYTPPETKSYQRETPRYPSLNSKDVCGVAAKPAAKVYTGTLIKGIATMHKSNAVPILNKQDAIDISNMRRN